MSVPAAGVRGSFTSIENSILINLFTANIIESSWRPPDFPQPHLTVPFDRAVLAIAVLEFAWKQKGRTVLLPSRRCGFAAESLFPSPSCYWHPGHCPAVSKACPGYVNSILLRYLFLTCFFFLPCPQGFFLSFILSFFFFFSFWRHHKGHISLCYWSAFHFCSMRKNYEPGECSCPVCGCMSCRHSPLPRLRR